MKNDSLRNLWMKAFYFVETFLYSMMNGSEINMKKLKFRKIEIRYGTKKWLKQISDKKSDFINDQKYLIAFHQGGISPCGEWILSYVHWKKSFWKHHSMYWTLGVKVLSENSQHLQSTEGLLFLKNQMVFVERN